MPSKQRDPLSDFEKRSDTYLGKTRDVFVKGDGPAVIVISEIPGITPEVADFARRVAAAGFCAVMPHLFGDPGRPVSAGYTAQSITYACISREFATFAKGRSSPICDWLRALARAEHERCGGTGVGVVGMCLTGGFALAMMVDDTVTAPVLSQPSLPIALGAERKTEIGLADDELARVKERCDEGVCVLGLRFTHDPMVPAERFARLRAELGEHFIGVEIDSSPGNPHGLARTAHSVLSEEYRDEPGHPTNDAHALVVEHFEKYLLGA